ncbi:MAG: sulfatase-like hydrolase/transferase [Lachnospiraceae bacterium]|nr:sulfatase-like hydrolase/transferase [Lachnospiraceae bacterium]
MRLQRSITAVGLTASLLATQTGCGRGEATPAEEPQPVEEDYNILFITVDQEHYFSEYPEGTAYKARQLLAELGTTFEKHYACSNMSTSSRSVMFTGKHIPDTGMIDNTDFQWQGAMDENITTIGDRMREAGYYTALKGKWHLGDASIISDVATLTDLEGYGYADWGGKDYIGSVQEGYEMDPVVVSEALDWLGTKGKELNDQGKPFFLNVNMVNPHDIMNYDITGYQSGFMPLAGKPDDPVYNKTYDTPVPSTWNFDLNAADVPEALRVYQEHWGLFTGVIREESVWKDYQNYYFNCIQDSDDHLMEILDYLKEQGMMDNTVIVFTADHGEMQGSHGLKGKGGFLYENNVHVPLIIVHPGFEGGKTVSALTSHVDLAPTFVDMTSLPADEKEKILKELPGESLLQLMDGRKDSVRDAALFCFEMLSMTALQYDFDAAGNVSYSFDVGGRGMVRGIVTADHKFVRYFAPTDFNTPTTLEDLFAHNDVQLFDTKADPEEVVNLAADPETNGELILQMNELLNETIRREIGEDDGTHVLKVLKGLQQAQQQAQQ